MPETVVAFALASALALLVRDEADDQYHFVVGLCEKEMFELAADEAQTFLERWPEHARADHARYRLASALFALDRLEDAAVHYRKLAGRAGFEFQAEAAFRLAECALRAERFDEATAALERVLALDADYLHVPATFLLGEASFRRGDFAAARGRYAAALERDPKGPNARDARYGLAWCAFRLGEHDAARTAIAAFLRAHAGDPLAGEMRFLDGECLLESGRPADALAAYASVPDGPFLDAALRGRGFAAAALDRPRDAAAAFEELLTRFPSSRYAPEAALQGGIQLLEADDPKGAVRLLSTAAAGAAPEVLYWRGRARRAAGDGAGALADLEAGLRAAEDPALRERLAVARGDVLFELGRTEDAAKAYSASNSDYALHAAAVARLNDGRLDDARRLAEEFVKRHPESPYAAACWIVLGECRLAAGEHAPAVAAFERALTLDAEGKEKARVHGRLGWCRFLAEDPAGAAKEFRRSLEAGARGEERAEALSMLGRSLEAAGDADGAREAWRTFRREHAGSPQDADVLLGLARLDTDAAATSHLEELLKRHPDHAAAPDALLLLAERRQAAGDAEGAATAYRELLHRFPTHASAAPARYGLAWCHYDAERFEPAAAELETLLRERSLAPDVRLAALELLVFASQRANDAAGLMEAFERFRKACKDEARVLAAGRAAASTLAAAGKADDADRLLRSIEAKSGDGARSLRIERAYLALDRGDPAAAAAQLDPLVEAGDGDPAAAEAAFHVAEALFDGKDDARAIPLYAYAARVEKSPVVDRALYKEGFARMRGGDLEGAARTFARLVDAHEESPLWGEAQFLRGEVLFRLDRLEEAAKALAVLRKKVPTHAVMPKALFRLGVASCRLRAYADAEDALTELARQHPDFEHFVEAELWRGRALAAEGEGRAARQALERVIHEDRGVLGAQARIELGRLHFAAGDAEAALSEFLKVSVLYAAEAENAEALYLAGRCLEKVGDPTRARSQYEEIVRRFPGSAFAADARERLAELKAF